MARTQPVVQYVADQRLKARFSINESVQTAHQEKHPLFALHSTPDEPGLFRATGIRYGGITKTDPDGTTSYHDPYLDFCGHSCHGTHKDGSPWPSSGNGRRATGIFSDANKMPCPSFSLPSGPHDQGGSCVVSNDGLGDRNFVCNHCYASNGNYIHDESIFSLMARREWILTSLERDPSGNSIAKDLISAIRSFAEKIPIHGGAFESERDKSELGVWKRGRIQALDRFPRRNRPDLWTPLREVELAPWTKYSTSTDVFARMRPPPMEGEITGFFRLHDSGDFSVGTTAQSVAYLDAWAQVAHEFPHVLFWAPTRLWIRETFLKKLKEVKKTAKNILFRPSAAYLFEPAPMIPGLSAGTTITRMIKGEYLPTSDSNGKPTYLCPVIPHGGYPESCNEANCRTCWARPNVPVTFRLK